MVWLDKRYMLLQLIVMSKVKGKRRSGRRKTSWPRNIREWTSRVTFIDKLFNFNKFKNTGQ